MDFQLAVVGPGREPVIVAEGAIDNGTAGRLQSLLASHPELAGRRPVILFSSPGGTVLGAIALGRYLRSIDATSVVGVVRDFGGSYGPGVAPGVCVASCVYAFLGGASHTLPARSVLGVKPMRLDGSAARADASYGQVVAALRAYMRAVGVDPRFADYCEDLPGDALHVLAPAEIARWRLADRR